MLIYSLGTGWANIEFRSYQLSDDESDSASIIETVASRQRRKAPEKHLTKTEQMKLKERTIRLWEDLGFRL